MHVLFLFQCFVIFCDIRIFSQLLNGRLYFWAELDQLFRSIQEFIIQVIFVIYDIFISNNLWFVINVSRFQFVHDPVLLTWTVSVSCWCSDLAPINSPPRDTGPSQPSVWHKHIAGLQKAAGGCRQCLLLPMAYDWHLQPRGPPLGASLAPLDKINAAFLWNKLQMEIYCEQ